MNNLAKRRLPARLSPCITKHFSSHFILSALSIGHKGALTNTDVLHGRPLQIKLIKDTFESNKKDDNGNAKMLECNKITGYRSMAEAEADGGGDSGQASTPAEDGSSAKKGWT